MSFEFDFDAFRGSFALVSLIPTWRDLRHAF